MSDQSAELWAIVKSLYPHEAKHAETVLELMGARRQIAGLQEALRASRTALERDQAPEVPYLGSAQENGSESLADERVET